MTECAIRPATHDDVALFPDVERRAGEVFRTIGMDTIADDAPPPADRYHRFVERGDAFVADDPTHGIVGYLLLDTVDGLAHIEQVSVVPEVAGRGIGRRLIDHADAHAAVTGRPGLSLTTFRDVPWNAPYYERLGFRTVDDDRLGPELRAVVDREAADGLDPTTRVCMRRPG